MQVRCVWVSSQRHWCAALCRSGQSAAARSALGTKSYSISMVSVLGVDLLLTLQKTGDEERTDEPCLLFLSHFSPN